MNTDPQSAWEQVAYLAYKFRLYPNATQECALMQQLETLRQVYNACLGYWKDKYEFAKAEGVKSKSPSSTEIYRIFSSLRNLQIADQRDGGAGPHWLTHVSAVSMRDTCERVRIAFENFFRRVKQKAKKAGHPRFKKYGRLTSIPFACYENRGCILRDSCGRNIKSNSSISRSSYRLDLFGVGKIKIRLHRAMVGTIKTVCVQRDVDGKWYVVFTCQNDAATPESSALPPAGIDMGLERFLTASDGAHEPNPRLLKGELKNLRRLQRASSRKMEAAKKRNAKFRECKNLQKSFQKTARLHVRVRNQRKEHHYQVANRLVHKYGTICAENLNVQGMVRNGKLSRAIQDAGWSGFLTVLKRKAESAGVRFVEVDARYTSQTCPECGAVAKKKLSQRRHCCPCGYEAHRDHAAARVILARGMIPDAAGQVAAVRVEDPIVVGMPREQSCGGRRGQRKSPAKLSLPKAKKSNRSRKGLGTPTIPGMEE